MSHATNYFEDLIARFFRSASLTKPAAHYLALFTTLPDDSGANGVEVSASGTGYARVRHGPADANWSAPVSGDGTLSNLTTIAFGNPVADWNTLVGWGLYDALTAGNALILAPLETPLTVKAGDPPPVFAAGDLVITLA
jgi:hypothetical protein